MARPKKQNIRKAARQARRTQRQAAKTARQAARQATRQAKADARQVARVKRQDKRLNVRDTIQSGRQQRKLARKSVRNAKQLEKIYGEMSPEDVNAVNSITPYVGAMQEILEERGVELEDPYDPIEVAAKFEYNEPLIEEPFDYNELDAAYYSDDDEYGGYENFFGERGKSIMKGVLGGISGAMGSFVNDAKDKQRTGEPLSKSEDRLLQANQAFQEEIRSQLRQRAESNIGETFMKILPFLAIGLIAYMLFFNKNK